MNLEKLFQMQKELDDRILAEHPIQEGEDRLAKKILALQVELGELANCWRGFKYWSYNQKPKTEELGECPLCKGTGDLGTVWAENCIECGGSGKVVVKNPLLEEYVDALHFILSIGLELNIPEIYGTETKWDELTSVETDITQQFLLVFENVNTLVHVIDWLNLFADFYILGELLGFTWEQIEEAYMSKNAENHARQENGY